LPGTDGVHKMSKSLGNVVGLLEDPLSMYSKLEKVPDAAVESYLTLLTDLDPAALPADARERQKAMAVAVTADRHGDAAARRAQEEAGNLVLRGGGTAGAADEAVPAASLAAVNFPAKAFYLLSALELCPSSSEARRRIQGGGVRLDGEKITDPDLEFAAPGELEGRVLQLGKKVFRRLVTR
jgi:tyrosyl-tRNA synthetase